MAGADERYRIPSDLCEENGFREAAELLRWKADQWASGVRRLGFTTFVTFRQIRDVMVEYRDRGYEPDTNAHEIEWWFPGDDMRDVEVTPEEDDAICAHIAQLEPSYFPDDVI